MTDEYMTVNTLVDAPAEVVFDLLVDPSAHVAIDGTGWVQQPIDAERLMGTGQVFRMRMYHDGHPNKHYEMANRIEVFDRPRAIAWQPGAQPRHIPGHQGSADGPVEWGGWIWRYDLHAVGVDKTNVTLTYDWSRVPLARRDITFPPFSRQHLADSLEHLAALAERTRREQH